MNINNMLQTDVLDILFTGKNKSYGAYQLRKNYNKRLSTALLAMIGFCLIFSSFYRLQAARQSTVIPFIFGTDVTLENTPVKEQPPVVKPPRVKLVPAVQHIATVKVTPPVIVTDNLVTEPPATQAAMEGIRIDVTTTTGIIGETVAPPINTGTGAIASLVKVSEAETEVHFVQQQAQFSDGPDAWKRFLEHNLRSDVPTENGAPAGNYTVIVSFLVDKTGTISEVKAENDPGYGTAAEAVRVIQRGPAWKPAVQNGRNVIYRQRQAITFIVAEHE